MRQLQSWGYPARLIDADELKRLEPSLDIGPVAVAEYSPNEGQVEPQMVVDACLRRLREMGCEIHPSTEVQGFEQSSRWPGPQPGSRLRIQRYVDAVVIAAGVGTTRLAALAGVNVPQAQSPGVVIRTGPSASSTPQRASGVCPATGTMAAVRFTCGSAPTAA